MAKVDKSMSLVSLFAPAPSTIRAEPVHLSFDPKSERIAYTVGNIVCEI